MLRSRPDRYGSGAVTIQWLTAILIVAALVPAFKRTKPRTPQSRWRSERPAASISRMRSFARTCDRR